ncbi:MAG: PspC domain-containing protein [Actinomycetota bacterium]|jgi:phage shock protein C|nr:PspC domain-containing protein [Actinomycetota bacterium]
MERRLYRSRSQRMVAGVCGGIAEYFDIDPTIVRLIAVLLTVIGNGAAFVAYVVVWIAVPEAPVEGSNVATVMPVEPSATVPEHTAPKAEPDPVQGIPPVAPIVTASSGRGTMIFGLVLVIIGIAFVAEAFIPGIDIWQLWPLILVGLGLRMIITGKGD